MAPDRLQSYVDGLLRASKSPPEIVERLTGFGLDRQAATGMVTNSLDGQWIEEGGGGQPLGRVGPKRMIVGLLLMLSGAAASLASYTHFRLRPQRRRGRPVLRRRGRRPVDFVYGLLRWPYG